jgi:hypothetical protein
MVQIMRLRLQGGRPRRGFQRDSLQEDGLLGGRFQRLGTGASGFGDAAHHPGGAFSGA